MAHGKDLRELAVQQRSSWGKRHTTTATTSSCDHLTRLTGLHCLHSLAASSDFNYWHPLVVTSNKRNRIMVWISINQLLNR